MKKIFLFIGMLALGISCSKFMEESSQDLMVPRSVKDYKEFIYGDGFDNKTVMHPYLEVMTDDVDEFRTKYRRPLNNDTRQPFWAYYTWQPFPEVGKLNELTADVAWGKYYHKILISNIIIDKISEIEGTPNEKYDLAGEAYFLRAHSYFMLANLYGMPYRKESAKNDFCVPFNYEIGVEDKALTRENVAAVYDLIVDNIEKSIACFKQSDVQKTIFRPNLPTAYLFASRVMLYMENFETCTKYADSVLTTSKATLADLNTLGIVAGDGASGVNFFSTRNQEILYSYGAASDVSYLFDYKYTGAFAPSKSLIDLYVPNKDLRAKQYYKYTYKLDGGVEYNVYTPMKWHKNSQTLFAKAFRLSEAYLNRAEAYAQLGKIAEAQRDLNTLREMRFVAGYSYEQILAGKEDAIEKIRNERRMEFAFEEFRWFDLRRYGSPELNHRYSLSDTDYSNFKITKGGNSYILPLPKTERELNLSIENVDRPETILKN